MSVLIKGMRMPENCGKCPFLIEEDIDFDISHQCEAGKVGYIYEADLDSFPTDCPLVDLGRHGDLIDRDVLVKESMADGAYGYVDTETICDMAAVIKAEGENEQIR